MMSQTVSYVYNAPTGGTPSLQRSTDGAWIPLDLENMDYQAFLSWVAAGNTAPSGWTGPTNPT
jgi:hypothetical protein